jgi:hypothetical protein
MDREDDSTTNNWVRNISDSNDHLTFGGLIQNYNQTDPDSTNPQYTVQVVDPREILSNTTLILNDYAGTTFDNANLLNLFGLLEHDLSDDNVSLLTSEYSYNDPLTKTVYSSGKVSFTGDDLWKETRDDPSATMIMTGQGLSRRSDYGIPWYRVRDSLNTIFRLNSYKAESENGATNPVYDEYIDAGYGGVIDFRGFKYVVDLTAIPQEKIPPMYYVDFSQLDILSLVQEICDVISHDFYVRLLPVIDHPYGQEFYKYNETIIAKDNPEENKNLIVGIIRVDVVDRSKKPEYGAIKTYIENMKDQGLLINDESLGYELSNITTDKFVAGGQTVDMHFFSTNKDRDILEVRKKENGKDNLVEKLASAQWYHETSLNQQVLPFYGFLGDDAVTIPRGWGAYQQIQLDTNGLNAHGVGKYYIATELELRAASVSYERWAQFLAKYNDLYMQSLEEDDTVQKSLLQSLVAEDWIGQVEDNTELSNTYGVTVPRCVFDSDDPTVDENGWPNSPCSPPYGYPLYYKRSERIGIPYSGISKISSDLSTMFQMYAKLDSDEVKKEFSINYLTKFRRNLTEYIVIEEEREDLNEERRDALIALRANIEKQMEDMKNGDLDNVLQLVKEFVNGNDKLFKGFKRLSDNSLENSRRVYAFLKKVADQYLGKSFLVKIPKQANVNYSPDVSFKDYGDLTSSNKISDIVGGPFGFDSRPVNSDSDYRDSQTYQDILDLKKTENTRRSDVAAFDYLVPDQDRHLFANHTEGSLKVNFNPITDMWDYNYGPSNSGYLKSDVYEDVIMPSHLSKMTTDDDLPISVKQKLFPTDATNFFEEDGKMSCYVRFDNSHLINFANMSPSDYVQEVLENDTLVPDVAMHLDNTKTDKFHSLPAKANDESKDKNDTKRSIAFVKCTVDDRFYMPAKTELKSRKVFGRSVIPIPKYSAPRLIFDTETETYKESYSYYEPHYVPDKNGGYEGGALNIDVPGSEESTFDYIREEEGESDNLFERAARKGRIKTFVDDLDSDNVYAIIHLPNRIQSTMDSRFVDGPFQAFATEAFKNHMLMDTITEEVKGFDKPQIRKEIDLTSLQELCDLNDVEDVRIAFAAYRDASRGLSLASPEKSIMFASSSPIYPSMVGLPLISHERCYGPWVSSNLQNSEAEQIKGIGGKIDFIKEESLAPWNYNGYTVLEEVGNLRAEFSNSLLLFSESGSFSFPAIPHNVSLCSELITGGPLVTNVSVSISNNSIQSSYAMDIYTPRFGELQKQKDVAISQMVREKQRLRDEKNKFIRQGIGKKASNFNFSKAIGEYSNASTLNDSMTEFTEFQRSTRVSNVNVTTVKRNRSNRVVEGETEEVTTFTKESSNQPMAILEESSGMPGTESDQRQIGHDTVVSGVDDQEWPVTDDLHHRAMPNTPNTNTKASSIKYYSLYKQKDD